MATFNIPMEIVTDILSRLPVKSLHRFKAVCKFWQDVIESQEFFKFHFDRSLRTNSYNCSLILGIGATLYRSHVDINSSNFTVDKLVLPKSFQSQFVSILGSCNGLVFVMSGTYHLAICNPALDQVNAFKILPCMEYPGFYESHYQSYYVPVTTSSGYTYNSLNGSRQYSFFVFGFGFDCISRYYKIVRLSPKRALVSSMKAGQSWREVEVPFPDYNLRAWGHGVAVNNFLHWNITRYDPAIKQYCKEMILTFDLQTEQWGEEHVPEGLRCPVWIKECPVRGYIVDVGVLDGCLCLLNSGGISYSQLDLWVMKEYGVKESWTKWFSVPTGSGIPLVYCRERYEFLLPGTKYGLGWYSPRDKRITKAEFYGDKFSGEHCYTLRVKKCIECFVLPFTEVPKED